MNLPDPLGLFRRTTDEGDREKAVRFLRAATDMAEELFETTEGQTQRKIGRLLSSVNAAHTIVEKL